MIENIHWLGHAGFKIKDKVSIFIDPYQIRQTQDKADIILITHGHFDHCSKEDIKKISTPSTITVTPLKASHMLKGHVRALSPGGKINLKGVDIEAVPAYNIGKAFHPKSEGNLGFILTVNGTKIYHAGDTDFIPEMKSIKADIVLLPVGGTYTMNAKEAAEAANAINPKVAIPMHWGSIVGSREAAEQFQKLCKSEVKILELTKEQR